MNAKHAKTARAHMKNPSLKSKIMVLIICLSLSLTLVFSGASSFAWMYTARVTDGLQFNKQTLSISIVDVVGQQLIPGKTYTLSAAPTVTVAANSAPCYLFVRIYEPTNHFDNFSFHSNFTQYSDTQYYYKAVATSTSDQTFQILTNNQIKARDALTHTDGTLTGSTITFRSCAIQQANLTIDQAKDQVDAVI